ncbi:LPS-assembly protein LptD [Phenylobacterium sp.]|jgi:LPS-assembly protein|uniref:LPS-assembly protein LptD n=1 Tax=Phenylobacterium sp. TaxID=1871053 RepID=UPI002E33B41D|nr:LPS-assembly protein LptD [Phenylobacterium sp.]HEX2559692.1 LPS-assembly protein LptD [Phenylobacterium sp.]
MSSLRRLASTSAKRVLLAGAAWAILSGAAAHAQAPEAPGPDGLRPDELYMEADLVTYDDKGQIATATGEVEVRYQGRTLRANELVYDQTRGVITAKGNAQILNADGTAEFADEIVLDEEMKAGAAIGFSARLQQNVKMAAATAVRRDETHHELNRAIYTPCDTCVGEQPKTPTWSIRADRIVQDKDRQIVWYRNAVIQVFGAPVLFLPVFWHTDPQAERKSGLLPPKLGISDRRGLSYEQPYVHVISPYSDVVISPQINTEVNPFLNLHYRKRFYSGEVDARVGYTYEKDFDGDGDRFGDATHRSYILASGAFRPAEHWRWGFTLERTSDDFLFDKYEIGDVFESRGPYVADDRRLISQTYGIRQDQNSYLSIAAMSIQGLRPDPSRPPIVLPDGTQLVQAENDRLFPGIAPLIEGRWEPEQKIAGGRLRLRGSAVGLFREQSHLALPGQIASTVTTPYAPGLDSFRSTVEADWRASHVTSAGLRVDPFVQARFDAYRLNDVPGRNFGSDSFTRGLAVAGVDLSWPFFRRFSTGTVVLEPLVQLAVSPDAQQVEIIPRLPPAGLFPATDPVYLNEDSLAFEFDETNLFRPNKFPGFDLYEDGARLNAGGRASVLWDDGRRASFLLGRSFRSETNEVFPARSGLRGRSSDWIVAAEAEPLPGISLFGRARLDGDSLEMRRAEFGANANTSRGYGFVRYLRDDLDIGGTRRENIDLGGRLTLHKNWGVSAYGSRDIQQDAWVVRDLGVFYQDECTLFEVIYRREDAISGRLGPSDSIAIRLTLATLGEPIYAD